MNTPSVLRITLFSSAVLLASACADAPVCECDASITKVALTSFPAGGTGKFGILVDYSGHPLCSSGAICIHDVLAPGLTFASASPSDWTCSATGQDVRCCFNGPLPVTHTALPMLELTVNVSPKVGDAVKNCASIEQDVKGDFTDNDDANNTSCTSVKVDRVDLSIEKHHVGTFSAGGIGVFELAVSNNSASPATGVTVTDVLDPALTFISGSPSPPWTCAAAGQTVTCTFAGAISPFTSAPPIELNVQVNDKPKQTDVKNCASVSSDGVDIKPKNNSSCDTVEITTCSVSDANLSSGIVSASNLPGAVGTLDDTWNITQAPGGSMMGPATIHSPHPAWKPALPGSQWIGPPNGPALGTPGAYVYESCFCLNEGFTSPTLALSMRADNQITDVHLNGCQLPGTPGGTFSSMAPLQVSTSDMSCFHPGMNCVDITVQNAGGPTGLNVSGNVKANNGLCCP